MMSYLEHSLQMLQVFAVHSPSIENSFEVIQRKIESLREREMNS